MYRLHHRLALTAARAQNLRFASGLTTRSPPASRSIQRASTRLPQTGGSNAGRSPSARPLHSASAGASGPEPSGGRSPEAPVPDRKKMEPASLTDLRYFLGLVGRAETVSVPAKPIEPLLVAVDVEAWEQNTKKVLEVGIAVLDPRLLPRPSQSPHDWTDLIRTHHYIIEEHKHLRNGKFVLGCPDHFLFGESEVVKLAQMPDFFRSAFHVADEDLAPRRTNGSSSDKRPSPDPPLRDVVLVGHDVRGDIKWMRELNFPLHSIKAPFVGLVDTQRIADALTLPLGLSRVVTATGIDAQRFHNGGNDANYTMQLAVRFALGGLVHEEPSSLVDARNERVQKMQLQKEEAERQKRKREARKQTLKVKIVKMMSKKWTAEVGNAGPSRLEVAGVADLDAMHPKPGGNDNLKRLGKEEESEARGLDAPTALFVGRHQRARAKREAKQAEKLKELETTKTQSEAGKAKAVAETRKATRRQHAKSTQQKGERQPAAERRVLARRILAKETQETQATQATQVGQRAFKRVSLEQQQTAQERREPTESEELERKRAVKKDRAAKVARKRAKVKALTKTNRKRERKATMKAL